MKKVYFAGSIRAGRNDAPLYQQAIQTIQRYATVLTEHIGDMSKAKVFKDQDIYETDVALIRQADMIIAECTTPSLGVGYELAYGERYNIPVYVFYRPQDTHLSAMIAGNSHFHIEPYTTPQELCLKIQSLLTSEFSN